jgi:hypothetical protein
MKEEQHQFLKLLGQLAERAGKLDEQMNDFDLHGFQPRCRAVCCHLQFLYESHSHAAKHSASASLFNRK